MMLLNFARAQEKVNFSNKKQIPISKIQTKQVNNKTTQYVDQKDLKQGYNYMTLKTGDILYIEYKGGIINSFTLSNKKGIIRGKLLVVQSSQQFQCSQNFCSCSGDGDCNDMFTTNVCGPDAVCFGNICVCYR